MFISPAGAHVGGTVTHLWTQHIKPKVTALVYTKTQSNARYLGKTAKAADANLLDGVDSSLYMRDDVVVVSSTSTSDSTSPKFHTITCPSGRRAVGGGGAINNGGDLVALQDSHPASFGNNNVSNPAEEWWVTAKEVAAYGSNWSVSVYAVCVPPL